MKVFKYELPVTDIFTLELPQEAEVLTVQVQYGKPCIWARVNPDAKTEERKFRIAGAGNDVEADARYIGTFQLENGSLVFHLFEK